MPAQNLKAAENRRLLSFVHRYPLAHVVIGLVGNLLFVVGSLLFVMDRSSVGKYLFLIGSSAMLVGALGEVARIAGQRRLRRRHIDPETGEVDSGRRPSRPVGGRI